MRKKQRMIIGHCVDGVVITDIEYFSFGLVEFVVPEGH